MGLPLPRRLRGVLEASHMEDEASHPHWEASPIGRPEEMGHSGAISSIGRTEEMEHSGAISSIGRTEEMGTQGRDGLHGVSLQLAL